MVSLQAALSQLKERPRPCSPITNAAAGDNSSSSSSSSLSKKNKKKRKWEDHDQEILKDQYNDLPKAALPCREYLKLWMEDDAGEPVTQQPPAAGAIDLHLDTPLPPEWQRCLDIQSGKIHFYNTRTHTRTSRDPRESAADETTPPPPAVAPEYARPFSLDLELNLMCESTSSPRSHGSSGGDQEIFSCDHMAAPRPRGGAAVMAPPSTWVSMDDADPGEMVAAVCGRCHMLVVMCKSSPSCPNCKFLHAPDQMPPSAAMLKPGAQALVL